LIRIADRNGCSRDLDVAPWEVKVQDTRPAGRFATREGEILWVLEGEPAYLPLQLTGKEPFTVTLSHNETGRMQARTNLWSGDSSIKVDHPGIYSLVDVKDSFCGGIAKDVISLEVAVLPKPSLQLLTPISNLSVQSHPSAAEGLAYIYPPVCRGVDSYFDVTMQGRRPFSLTYSVKTERVDSMDKRVLSKSREEIKTGPTLR
ncbi:hypothetical protein HDU93_004223, partial [Gonapodya sp. JEL0774]